MMHKVLCCLFVFLVACGSGISEEVVSTWPNGQAREVHLTDANIPGIEVQQFHENGRLHVRGRQAEGQREGTWNTYREDGLPWSQVEYVSGRKQGLFRTWYPSGVPHIEGQHSQGAPSGSWRFFSSEGQLLETVDFEASN